jgi:hypothetical protein
MESANAETLSNTLPIKWISDKVLEKCTQPNKHYLHKNGKTDAYNDHQLAQHGTYSG